MKLAIMQPYLFPYIGYFQLIRAVDTFIIYDNIKYTKKGWINRNRFLQNGKDVFFSVPLKNDSDYLDVRERFIATDFNKNKLLNQIKEAYRKAPHFALTFPLFERVVKNNENNLFRYIYFSVKETCEYLGINSKIVTSSTVNIDHSLQAQDKVVAICQHLGANTYINAIGGQELYSKEAFRERGLELKFIKSNPIEYKQFNHDFVPWLSIIDVMMFNTPEAINKMLNQYELL